jgi:alpha-mannosidase
VTEDQPVMEPLFTVSPSGVMVSYLKPLGQAKGFLVRLYNAGGKPEEVRVSLRNDLKSVWLSNAAGEKLQKLDIVETDNYLSLPSYGVVTLVIN